MIEPATASCWSNLADCSKTLTHFSTPLTHGSIIMIEPAEATNPRQWLRIIETGLPRVNAKRGNYMKPPPPSHHLTDLSVSLPFAGYAGSCVQPEPLVNVFVTYQPRRFFRSLSGC